MDDDTPEAMGSASLTHPTLAGANAVAYQDALNVANQVLSGQLSDPTAGASFFYSGPQPAYFATAINEGLLSITATTPSMTFLREN